MHMAVNTQGAVAASPVNWATLAMAFGPSGPVLHDPLTSCSWVLTLPLTGCYTTCCFAPVSLLHCKTKRCMQNAT